VKKDTRKCRFNEDYILAGVNTEMYIIESKLCNALKSKFYVKRLKSKVRWLQLQEEVVGEVLEEDTLQSGTRRSGNGRC
jgi:hypothetical protein